MKNLTSLFNAVKQASTSPFTHRHLSTTLHKIPNTQRILSTQFQKLQATRIEGVVLDWSGTTADAHVIAPAVVFEEVFKKQGVPISNEEARLPMGLRKDLHIAEILKIPAVQTRWLKAKGKPSTQTDIDKLFTDFVPIQLDVLPQYTTLIPGTVAAVARLRNMGIKIGCTTGFTADMVDILLKDAAKQGYVPDASVAGDNVIHGARPTPHMLYKNMDKLGIHLPGAIVKVDDTLSGVGEGLSAGAWAVGIWGMSNYTGIESLAQLATMSAAELEQRQEQSREILMQSGAHYIIKDISLLPAVVEKINQRIKNGETPESAARQRVKKITNKH